MYPVAVTLLPLRILFFVFMLFLPYLTFKIFYFGLDTNKPITGWRSVIAKKLYTFFCRLNLLSVGITVRQKEVTYDYEKWLGADY